MEIIGIIDIGSNTVHLTIVKINDYDNYNVLYSAKEHLRLGANLNNSKIISYDKIIETTNLLKKYICFCSKYNVTKIYAVATEALRISKNNNLILKFIKNEINLDIHILSKREESYLSFLGTISTFNINKGTIIDLGGSSTEFISVKNNSFKNYISLPYGSINITENIIMDTDGSFKKCLYDKNHFKNVLSNIPFIDSIKDSPIIGVGGTFKNLKQIEECILGIDNRDVLMLDKKILINLCKMIYDMGSIERKELNGLNKKRYDTILGGCYLIHQIAEVCNPSSFILTTSGLRQGIIKNYFKKEISI